MNGDRATGPLGMPRPGVRCDQQLTVQLLGDIDDVDVDAIEDNISQSVSVSVRPARLAGDIDVIVKKGSSLFLDEDLDEMLGGVRQAVLDTNEVEGWRVEAV